MALYGVRARLLTGTVMVLSFAGVAWAKSGSWSETAAYSPAEVRVVAEEAAAGGPIWGDALWADDTWALDGPELPPAPPAEADAPGAVRMAHAAPPPGAPGPDTPPDRRAGPPGGPPPAQMRLARILAAAETAVGIRADQIDAWRSYTDALQALAAPPPPPPAPPAAGTKPEAFTLTSAFAAHMVERGQEAARLKEAATTLKARLAPEQLERLARIEPVLLPPPPRPPGPPRGGMADGPPGGSPRGPAAPSTDRPPQR